MGGAPVSRSNSNFLAVDPGVLGRGLWVVGDSVFPGQGTMATVLSAIRVVERITGVSWSAMRDLPAAPGGPVGMDGPTTDNTNGTDKIGSPPRHVGLIECDPCDS